VLASTERVEALDGLGVLADALRGLPIRGSAHQAAVPHDHQALLRAFQVPSSRSCAGLARRIYDVEGAGEYAR